MFRHAPRQRLPSARFVLRLLTFGGLSLVNDGAPVTGAASQRSRLALLALLATAGPAGVAREKVLACLWPESDDERARHALKQSVYALRRDLGNENAIAGTTTLTLDPTIVASDIREFEDAIARGDDATALSLYTGPFLDGVFVKTSAEFDQWAGSERSRLERVHLDAIGRLARAADAVGDMITSLQLWRRSAVAEPLSGRVAVSLMRALAESGDVSGAIQHARVHDAMVRGELDSPADEAVLTFAEELRSGTWTPTAREPRSATLSTVRAIKDTEPATDTSVRPSEPLREPIRTERRRTPWIVAAVAIVAIAIGAAIAPQTRARVFGIFGAPRGLPSSRRIVVAAFTNHTGDTSLDPLGELAADWLARVLLEADFEVVDYRTSTLASRAITRTGTAHERAAALAAQTDAATVVTGGYYRQGDTLQFEANVIDAAKQVTLHAVGPLFGPASQASALLGRLANRVTAAMAASTDSTAGASTASLVTPPSVEAFEHASRAWEMFFARPADTAAVFAELARAAEIDTAYTAPLLMRAYVLDVKERWPELAEAVQQLGPRRAQMGRIERAALALFEADLRGDLLGRLRASRELLRLSPGSADMALLVAVSSSYLNRPAEAHAVLSRTSPDSGINGVSPMYWAWRAESEHALGRYEAQRASAMRMQERFPSQPYGAMALARAYAAMGDTTALNALLAKSGMHVASTSANARALALTAASELRAHGKAREAAGIFQRLAAMPPGRDASRDELSKHAFALYEAGDLAQAKTAYASLVAKDPNDVDAIGRLGAIAARLGDSVEVHSIDRRLSQWALPYAFGRPAYWRAHLAALTGRTSDAVSLLHSALAQGYRPLDLSNVTLHEDPDFLSMANDAAFHDLVRPRDGPAVLP